MIWKKPERWNRQQSHCRCRVQHELIMKETCDVSLHLLLFWLAAVLRVNLCITKPEKCAGVKWSSPSEQTNPQLRVYSALIEEPHYFCSQTRRLVTFDLSFEGKYLLTILWLKIFVEEIILNTLQQLLLKLFDSCVKRGEFEQAQCLKQRGAVMLQVLTEKKLKFKKRRKTRQKVCNV